MTPASPTLLLAFCLFLGLVLPADSRTWTSADGRTLEAEFISSADGKITVRRNSDGRTLTLSLEQISPDDRTWLEERMAELNKPKPIEGPYADKITGDWARGEHDELPYCLYGSKDLNGAEKYPLLVVLHGKSQNNENGKQTGMCRVFTTSENYAKNPCIILSPLCYQPYGGTGGGWNDKPGELVLELIEDLVKNCASIDPDRIYLVGYSMGGFGTFHLLGQEPKLFAAGVPIAGGGNTGSASKMRRIPIWAWHGSKDSVVPVTSTQKFARGTPILEGF